MENISMPNNTNLCKNCGHALDWCDVHRAWEHVIQGYCKNPKPKIKEGF